MQILYESSAASRSCFAETAVSVAGIAGIALALAAVLFALHRRNPKSLRVGFDPRTLGITLLLVVTAIGLSFSTGSVEIRRLVLDDGDLVREACSGFETVREQIPATAIESRAYRHDPDERFTPKELHHQLVVNLADGRRLRVPLVAGGVVNDFAGLAAWAPDAMARYGFRLRELGEPVPPAVAALIPGG